MARPAKRHRQVAFSERAAVFARRTGPAQSAGEGTVAWRFVKISSFRKSESKRQLAVWALMKSSSFTFLPNEKDSAASI